MKNISAVVEKITRGTKSGIKAREIIANFFKENDEETNWKLIVAFRKKIHSSKIGRRAKKKISEIEKEILDYVCDYEKTKGTELDDIYEEISGTYENILRGEIEVRIQKGGDIPLAFIPVFWEYPEMLIILNSAKINTLNELIQCKQPLLIELFRESHEALSELVLLFKPIKVEFKVAHA